MAQIRLTKRGQALAAKRKSQKGVSVTALRKDEFRMYTLKNTGEKVQINESEIFPKRRNL